MTEWSMTSSEGMSGLIFCGSPPNAAIASRMATRSTTQGTPVKSCSSTRAGVYWISSPCSAAGSHSADRAHLIGGDQRAVLVAQQILQQHLEAVRETLESGDLVQTENLVRLVPDDESVAGTETVRRTVRHR